MEKGDIVRALSCGVEFKNMLNGEKAESNLGKLEARVLEPLSPKDRTKLENLDGGAQRKALGLLWAYLHRTELDDTSLNEGKFEAAPIAHALNQAFTSICLAFGNTAPVLASYAITQCLVQALPPDGSPLLQLPHFSSAIVKAIEGDSKTHLTVQKFMQMPNAKRRELAVGKDLLSERQYRAAVDVARQIPDFQVSKAFFKVVGEKYIIPGSLVSMIVKGRFIPPGSSNVPEINELDLEDIDPDEDDLDALLGRAKKATKNDKPAQPPLAYAPYYARDYSPRWHVFLSDSKQGKIGVPPFTFTTFDKPIFGDDRKPTFNMQTLKAQFQAPPQAGQYTFVMHLICDSYIGMDTKTEVTLVVEEASKAMEIQADDDISEPDEGKLGLSFTRRSVHNSSSINKPNK
jgi:translocation protein SEC63